MFDFLTRTFSDIFSKIKNKGTLSNDDVSQALAKVQEALLEADVPHAVIQSFCQDIEKEVVGRKVVGSIKPADQLVKVVHDRIKEFLGGQTAVPFSFQLPSVVLVMGLQGSGKTTTVGKLAHLVQSEAKSKGKTRRILVASVDFYRPAAVDQLEIVVQSVGASFYRATNTDPIKAAQEIYTHYQKGLFELLILDTAGRLHIDSNLLLELRSIDSIIKPKYKILVLDAMTGQESLSVAQAFEQGIGFDWSILTKMDSEVRGGAAFAFRYALKKPIMFIGTGEKSAELERFYPERIAGRILGMGDVVTLVEKAQEKIQQSEQEALYKSFSKGRMTLQDFADQLAMMSKLGSLSSLMKYIPGVNSVSLTPEMIDKGEQELKKFKAIISSMTPKERVYTPILDGSRKKRIAKGAGVEVHEVNLLLERFEQSQKYAKLIKNLGRSSNIFK